MNLRKVLTLFISKIILRTLRLVNWGGTSLPGQIARTMYPDILNVLSKKFKIIIITGTNGKTTTGRIVCQILKENNFKYISNKSGANLLNGIISTFIEYANLKGEYSFDTAVLEVDEAAFVKVTKYVNADYILVTNFFRDQLDRYGELYTTLNKVKEGIKNSPHAQIILNADDSLCVSLSKDITNQIYFYGFSNNVIKETEDNMNSDAMYCIYCKSKYTYSYHVYGHLGHFKCTKCGFKRPNSQLTCVSIMDLNTSYSKIEFEVHFTKIPKCYINISKPGYNSDFNHKLYTSIINIPGIYNIYNALSAINLSVTMNLPINKTITALGSFESGFGRMETINIYGKYLKIILVKNPTGFNQVLNYLLTETKSIQIAFIINDNAADGKDISWLWDVDFEKLNKIQENIDILYTSGIRAEDMAVRLKYAGIYTEKIVIEKTFIKLLDNGLKNTKEGNTFYILPTYTALLQIRQILKKRYNLKDFWK